MESKIVNKKICFVVSDMASGGIERVISVLLNELSNEFKIDLIFLRKRKNNFSIPENVRVLYTIKDENQKDIIKKIFRFLNIRKYIKKEKYDTVLTLGTFPAIYTLVSTIGIKQRLIVSERTDPLHEPNNKIVRLIRDKLYKKKADVIVCQTEDAKDYYKNISNNVVVIFNPIKDDLPERYTGKRNKNIVNFCRLTEQKNLKLLIDSFEVFHKTNKDYKLVIYGNGPLKDELLNYITEKNLNNHVFINDFALNIHEVVLDSAMFVSTSDYEGMSNSMLESLGIGLPTICTDCPVGGARTVISNYENGILVPVGDIDAVVSAMNYIVENPEAANKMSKEAIKIKKRLNAKEISQKWKELIIKH